MKKILLLAGFLIAISTSIFAYTITVTYEDKEWGIVGSHEVCNTTVPDVGCVSWIQFMIMDGKQLQNKKK